MRMDDDQDAGLGSAAVLEVCQADLAAALADGEVTPAELERVAASASRVLALDGSNEAQRLAKSERRAAMLGRTLDEWATAVLHLAADCTVLFANACARQMLERKEELLLSGGRLRVRRQEDGERLKAAVARAVAEQKGDSFGLRQEDELEALPCTVLPLPAGVGGEAAALIIIADPDAREPDQRWKWAAMFALTPSEADLVEQLRDGLSLAEIAEHRGVRLSTVKTLLQRVFDKTETGRQGALLAKVGRVPPIRHG